MRKYRFWYYDIHGERTRYHGAQLLLFISSCLFVFFFFACLIFGKFVRNMPSYNFRVTIQERSSRYLRVLSIQEHGNLLTYEFSEQFLRKILCAV